MPSDGFKDGDRVIEFRRSLDAELAAELKLCFSKFGYTKISKLSGISVSFLKNLAYGERAPSPSTVRSLEALKLPLSDATWAGLWAVANKGHESHEDRPHA